MHVGPVESTATAWGLAALLLGVGWKNHGCSAPRPGTEFLTAIVPSGNKPRRQEGLELQREFWVSPPTSRSTGSPEQGAGERPGVA